MLSVSTIFTENTNKITRSLNIFVRKKKMLLIFFNYISDFYFPQWWWSLEREGPIYKGKERKNSNVCLPYKIIFQLLVILFIIKLYARVNIFRFSEDLQLPPEICDSLKLYFLVKTIFSSSFQIETYSWLVFKQSSLRQKVKILLYHFYLSLYIND